MSFTGFSQVRDLDIFLIDYSYENDEVIIKNYVEPVETIDFDEEGNEIELTEYASITFLIDHTKEIIKHKNVVSVPVKCKNIGNSEGDITGFSINLIKTVSSYKLVNISTPYTHFFKKSILRKDSIFTLHSINKHTLNYLNSNLHSTLSKEYTEGEIKSCFLKLINGFKQLTHSNYLFIDNIEMGELTALSFFTQKEIEPSFNYEDKTIQLRVKVYSDIDELSKWGDLFQLTDDFKLNSKLRKQQEESLKQFFILTFKYNNSFPKPTFNLLEITPPSLLKWEPVEKNKYILKIKS